MWAGAGKVCAAESWPNSQIMYYICIAGLFNWPAEQKAWEQRSLRQIVFGNIIMFLLRCFLWLFLKGQSHEIGEGFF